MDFLRLRRREGCCCASFTALCNILLGDHSRIVHVHGIMIGLRSFIVFVLFVILERVLGEGLRFLIISLHIGCVIFGRRQGVDHFLHDIDRLLPSSNVCVHVRNKRTWRRSLHLFGRYITPNRADLSQIWKDPFDFELTGSEFLCGRIVISYVESNGFLTNVLHVIVELLCKKLRNAFRGCV